MLRRHYLSLFWFAGQASLPLINRKSNDCKQENWYYEIGAHLYALRSLAAIFVLTALPHSASVSIIIYEKRCWKFRSAFTLISRLGFRLNNTCKRPKALTLNLL